MIIKRNHSCLCFDFKYLSALSYQPDEMGFSLQLLPICIECVLLVTQTDASTGEVGEN